MMNRALLMLLFCADLTVAQMAVAHEENFEERVRDYLLANPEVILQSLEALNQRQVQAQLEQKLSGYPDLLAASALGIGTAAAQTKVVEFF